jgi:hypothetical protein
MEAAENRVGSCGSNGLGRSTDGSALVQSLMRPYAIVVCSILAKDPAQVNLSKHDKVVDTFSSDRVDQRLSA